MIIPEIVFPHVFPDMFGGIEFGAIGREPKKLHCGGNTKIFCGVPSCAVKEHEAEGIREKLGSVCQKERHYFRIDPGHDEGGHIATERINSSNSIQELPDNLLCDLRSLNARRPASSFVADSPEPRFILKEYPYRHAARTSCYHFVDDGGEFFLNSSWIDGFALMCRGRGPIFRQVWRWNSRYT